ncbi:glycerophosphodiester phosphodiesterase family protein [Rahnella inusitata]|uniref:glycerophosphodiester phosphodiesterase family protein n=1 Tax=Rahnella inusitata TaxID=58169 RepID=UPI0039AF949D
MYLHKKMILALTLSSLSAMTCAASLPLSPQIIAHRGGTADAPENTVPAIKLALENKADAVWITVQLSKDDIPVLYRPSDLKSLTDKKGAVSQYTAKELSQMDAGWAFGTETSHPYRDKHIGVPQLESVLKTFPTTTFYIDIKTPDADPQQMAAALSKVLQETHSLQRTRIYSTDSRYLSVLPATLPKFESRDMTRTALANITMAHQCQIKADKQPRWYALEMKREVEVVEKYTLGEARSKATLVWDKEAMDCFRSQGEAHIILIGINDEADYKQAKSLGADGVLVNSPALFKTLPR